MGNIKIAIDELVGSYPTCPSCTSRNVVRDAWTEWNSLIRDWVLKSVFDEFVCDACGESITPVWKIDKAFRQKRIARLNDEMRRGQCPIGSVVLTTGLQELGDTDLARMRDAVAEFRSFDKDNDPHGGHDFGAFEFSGQKLFWKIDYFDLDLQMHSPDAANPTLTHRVLTIMLASEY